MACYGRGPRLRQPVRDPRDSAEELGIEPGGAPEPERLAEVCARDGVWPSAAIATLRW